MDNVEKTVNALAEHVAQFNSGLTMEQVITRLTEGLQGESKRLKQMGIMIPFHLVDAHAKHMTGKWFKWRLTKRDRQAATMELIRMMEKYGAD